MADENEYEFENLEEVFISATNYVRQITAKLDSEKLLYFYGRFKQANEGKCNTSRPSLFDFQGKAKWDAWNKLGNMSKKQAMMEYVSLLTNIDQEWKKRMAYAGSNEGGDQPLSVPQHRQGMGVTVSTMARTERDLSEGEKTIFDWCKEGDVERVKHLLTQNKAHINGLDEEGLGLLHWASDRGLTEMVEVLLSFDADVNLKDADQQTALHYAVSCDHEEMTKLLVAKGIDMSAKDTEGNTAMDVASDDMKLLLHRLVKALT